MNFLGIDIGTGACKAVVFDEAGRAQAAANREYDALFLEGGGSELNSEEVISKSMQCISECSNLVEPLSIAAVGISSQGEAFTAIGKNGEFLSHAMISSDIRSEPYVHTWTKKFGEEKLYHITGHTAHPLFTLFKLLWLKDNKADIWKKSAKFLCFEDLLQFKLGIDPAISWSLAGRTMLFDVINHKWDAEILKEVGLNIKQLARPLASGTIAGKVGRDIADTLGLPHDAIVVTGGHDQPCGALGAGVTRPGMGMYATGSVECITAALERPLFSDSLRKYNMCTFDHTVNDLYVTLAYSLTGGNILKWFKDEFGHFAIEEAEKKGLNAYDLLLEEAGSEPSELLVLPYFTASGTPYFDTKTKGAILGLRLSTKRGELIRALLEGVAFEMRLNIEILEESGIEINELRAIGGGAKSPLWTQLKADVTGKKIITLNVTETGCLGAAMLACAAKTGTPVQNLAMSWIKPQSAIEPQVKNKNHYSRRFESYKQLYPLIKRFDF